MFQLDTAITNWRNTLLANQNITDSDVDELESHLRDEVDSLMLSGLSDEEAFMISAHRIGDQQAVGAEFAKVNPSLAWRRRAFWMFFGILISMVVGGIASVCSKGSAALLTWLNVNAYGSGITGVVIHIGVFVVLLFGVIFGLGLFTKGIKSKLSMSMVLVCCIIAIFILKAASFAINILVMQVFGMETFGQLTLGSRYGVFAWAVLWPLIVVTMLFVLWSSRPQRVR
ncbi:MAG: permease prefix domain 1-containing protein [Planctomycetota bacterium]|jgi:hypothetical protein